MRESNNKGPDFNDIFSMQSQNFPEFSEFSCISKDSSGLFFLLLNLQKLFRERIPLDVDGFRYNALLTQFYGSTVFLLKCILKFCRKRCNTTEKNVKYLLFEDDMNGISSEDLANSLKNLLVKESFMHFKKSYIWGHLFLSKKKKE